jgi:hypothetical protein
VWDDNVKAKVARRETRGEVDLENHGKTRSNNSEKTGSVIDEEVHEIKINEELDSKSLSV